ncbi:MAG: hypothetical protein ACT4QF_20560 [Sporichthyaceae bacterium]
MIYAVTQSAGRWVRVLTAGGERQDWVPDEQPASPDGGPGLWHVVSDASGNRWEWRPKAPPPLPPGLPAESRRAVEPRRSLGLRRLAPPAEGDEEKRRDAATSIGVLCASAVVSLVMLWWGWEVVFDAIFGIKDWFDAHVIVIVQRN